MKIGSRIKVLADYNELRKGDTGTVIEDNYNNNHFVSLVRFDKVIGNTNEYELYVNNMLIESVNN